MSSRVPLLRDLSGATGRHIITWERKQTNTNKPVVFEETVELGRGLRSPGAAKKVGSKEATLTAKK